MSPLPKMKPIVPWWQLGALLALCAAGIWFLLPDDPRLLEHLIRDGKRREARRLLDQISPAERATNPQRFRLLELKLARQELPPGDSRIGVRDAALEDFWRKGVETWRETNHSPDAFAELAAVARRLRDPAAAWKLLSPHFDQAPMEQQRGLVELLVPTALGQQAPATAAEIFARGHPAATRTSGSAFELARLWQLANQPAEALAALGEHHSSQIDALRLSLLRQLNRNREALGLLIAEADRSSGPPEPDLAAQLADVALAAGQAAVVVPAYRRFVDAHSRDLSAVRRMRHLLVSAGHSNSAVDFARRAVEVGGRANEDVLELARLLEWAGRPAQAFEVWGELAVKQYPGALERLMALNPGLFLDTELARVLQQIIAMSPRGDHLLALARLEVNLGRYREAGETFGRYLRSQPDPLVMLELARMHRENLDYASAESWFRRAVAGGAKADVRRELAELLVYQRRYAEALPLYAALLRESDAEEIVGPFTRLAESLGSFDEFARGLQTRVDASPAPTERDFVLLAYAYELAANSAQRRATLEAGLRRHPDSNDLRLQFAYLLAGQRQYAAAQQTLAAHSALHADRAAATLFLDLLRLNNDLAGERRFLAQPFGAGLAGDETLLERVARAREALGELDDAAQTWRALHERDPTNFSPAAGLARILLAQGQPVAAREIVAPFLTTPSAVILQLAAEIAAANGDHAEAERHQVAYLHAADSPAAEDWGRLGDFRHARGDRAGAEQAYTEALRHLHRQMTKGGAGP